MIFYLSGICSEKVFCVYDYWFLFHILLGASVK